jgi:hypothetical protein
MADRGSKWFRGALIAAVLVAVNCVFDPYYSIGGKASCAGVDTARLREVLEHDPQIKITRSGRTDDGTFDDCERGGIVVSVDISPDVVRVEVGEMVPPSAMQAPLWKERTDYICGRLTAACPGLGPWKSWDASATSDFLAVVVGVPLLVGAAVCAWLLIRARRRRRKPVAAGGGQT